SARRPGAAGSTRPPPPAGPPPRPGPAPGPAGRLTTSRMLVLGIESSCDETAAAVLAEGTLRSSIVESQDPIHARYGGVVPELASRRHLEVVLPVVARALDEGGVPLPHLVRISVTHGPGLVGSLL